MVDTGYIERFTEQINDDLNLPRAVAVTWDLVKDDLPMATKKVTLVQFDRVLGLRLAEWQPPEDVVLEAIMTLVRPRQHACRETMEGRRYAPGAGQDGWLRHRGHATRAAYARSNVETGNLRTDERTESHEVRQQRLLCPSLPAWSYSSAPIVSEEFSSL
jgi:hypothetical protein